MTLAPPNATPKIATAECQCEVCAIHRREEADHKAIHARAEAALRRAERPITIGDYVTSISNSVWSGPMRVTHVGDFGMIYVKHPVRGDGAFEVVDLSPVVMPYVYGVDQANANGDLSSVIFGRQRSGDRLDTVFSEAGGERVFDEIAAFGIPSTVEAKDAWFAQMQRMAKASAEAEESYQAWASAMTGQAAAMEKPTTFKDLPYAVEMPSPAKAHDTLDGAGRAGRKAMPIATGVVDYFPDALAAVAAVSKIGNEQHNPGSPLHWDRAKSTDEADCLMRHFVERGTYDTDGVRHSAKVAWRALALLQKEIEDDREPGETAEEFAAYFRTL